MLVPFGQLPIGDGLLPDGTRVSFFIDRDELDTVRLDGPAWKYDDARFIEVAIGDPDAIFEGLRRPNQAASLCHAVFPTSDPDEADESGSGTPPRFGFVFLAFSSLADMGHVVFDWEWRVQDDDEQGRLENWANDFARRAWKRA